MATLRDIKNRIGAVKNTSKITSAMKMVAAAKLKKAQNQIESARPYVLKLEDILSNVIDAVGDDYTHPLIKQHSEIKRIGLIVVSSDKGLCGSFNANLFKDVANFVNNDIKNEYPDAEVNIITVGKKSTGYFKKRDYTVDKSMIDVFQSLNFDLAKEIVEAAKIDFLENKYDKVLIYFNEFVNVITQRPTSVTLLPIEPKANTSESDENKKFESNYIFEPQQKAILDELLPKLVDIKLWRTLLESNAAEQASRMMAMDAATTNAKELINHLELMYNKARQAAITTEMLEIVSGANALEG